MNGKSSKNNNNLKNSVITEFSNQNNLSINEQQLPINNITFNYDNFIKINFNGIKF